MISIKIGVASRNHINLLPSWRCGGRNITATAQVAFLVVVFTDDRRNKQKQQQEFLQDKAGNDTSESTNKFL